MGHAACGCLKSPFNPRKKFFVSLIIFCFVSSFIMLYYTTKYRIDREDNIESEISLLKTKLIYLESQYAGKQEEIYYLQARNFGNINATNFNFKLDVSSTIAPEVLALLKNITGSRAAEALLAHSTSAAINTPFSLRLMPHLMENPDSLKPAYRMHADRSYVDVVIGVPTVNRDKESYLLTTLEHLIGGLEEKQRNTTLIVVFVGETDLTYVINVAHKIENAFPTHVTSGLIEVMSPHPSYYPDFEAIPLTLGDTKKRVIWRTKQNLDAVYLMAYASSKGTFYLMIEDDVVAKKSYMTEILKYISSTTISTPDWFFINFSTVGGIGKLFRSSDLLRFITYVQIFYFNMPIDWLLESYLADRICGMDKSSKACGDLKGKIRPTYKGSLFQHIGLYSSLKGKIQKVKDKRFGKMPLFFSHMNPELLKINCTIKEHKNNTIKKAYEGSDFFWGVQPKKGDVVEFWFKEPPNVSKFIFRTGNIEHTSDKLTDAVVEVLSTDPSTNFTIVGSFDEFGLAEGKIDPNHLPLLAIRLRVEENSKYWIIISEIELRTEEPN